MKKGWEITPFAGSNQCGWCPSQERCHEIARVHALVEETSQGQKCCILLCGEHSGAVVSMGTHPVGANCDMPGMSWNKEGCIIK